MIKKRTQNYRKNGHFLPLLVVIYFLQGQAFGQINHQQHLDFDAPTLNIFPTEYSSYATYQLSTPDPEVSKSKLSTIDSFMEWYIRYFPVPIGSYSQETDLLLGLSKYNAFTLRKGDVNDTITQASSISFFTYYTLKHQYKIYLSSTIMFNKNKYLWNTDIALKYYPLEFFGIGNETSLDNQTTLNTGNFEFSSFFLFKTWRKWYVGPIYDYYNYYNVSFQEGDHPDQADSIAASHNSGPQSGLGLKILMEGRDNRLNGKKGWFVEGRMQFYDGVFGSKFDYNFYSLDIRYYTTPLYNITIASRMSTAAKFGNVPIQSLVFLGGDYSLRGIYYGRYRDNVGVQLESELRFPIFWIFGGTVFGGFGQVADKYSLLNLDQFHASYGLGLRVRVDSENDVNLRFDLGFSNDQTLFIMNFSEAF